MKTTWCRTDGSERWVSAGLGLHQASWRDRPLALRVAGQTSPFLRWAVNWPRGQSVGLEECVSSVCVCVSVCVFGPRQPVIWFTLTRQQDRTIKMSIFSLSLSLSLSRLLPLSLCAPGRMGEVIKQNKPTGGMTSPKSNFWILNPLFCMSHSRVLHQERCDAVWFRMLQRGYPTRLQSWMNVTEMFALLDR